MSIIVPRTCTEAPADIGYGATKEACKPRPLGEFRSRPAYVLLGDPGSGKTTAFEQESQASGNTALMLSARDFTTFEVDDHPEWRHKTLFIDGLDEMRAGAADARGPLDQIRGQLDRLGKPSFRLSCREADWLGPNDRQSLSSVSPDGHVAELRLDPLSNQAVEELLRARLPHSGVSEFLAEAQQQRVAAMLSNPLTLNLLADAVDQGNSWPQSRQETFELACRRMATELNAEHRAAGRVTAVSTILDAAGWLCAQVLFTGAEGYSLTPVEDDAVLIALECLPKPPAWVPPDSLVPALAAALFTAAGDQRFQPRHRHIAEFLGGRYLAQLIERGLPARRVVALMTSPSDGRTVTDLRGLAAWLAAYSREARQLLIDADPVGAGLYGDISVFTLDDKQRLLRSLEVLAAQAPSLVAQQHDLAKMCRSLASGDMAPSIQMFLDSWNSEAPNNQMLRFILDVLSQANDSELESLTVFASELEAILFDASRSSEVRESALDAYIHIAPPSDTKSNKLLRVLEEINESKLPDPDGQLRGKLLAHLYPTDLGPSQVWRYVLQRKRSNLLGSFWRFWRFGLLEQSSDQEVAEFLDALHEGGSELLSGLAQSDFAELPLELLARGLEELGESVESWRRYNWLNAVRQGRESRSRADKSARRIRTWLEDHPEVQKDTFLTWLRHPDPDDRFAIYEYGYCDALHRSRPPADFGRWCLEQAVAFANSEPDVSEKLLRQAYHLLERPEISEGLTLEVICDRIRGHDTLAQLLKEMSQPHPQSEEINRFEREQRERLAQYEEEKRQRREEWKTELRAREDDLRENRFLSQNLYTLALVYFGELPESDSEMSPRDRISEFIGGDPILVEASMNALREAVFRNDVPEAAESMSLRSQSKLPFLAFPVLASLELIHRDDPNRLDLLSDAQRRNALTIYYCFPAPWGFEGPALAHDRWLHRDSELVLDVLYRCAIDAMRAGEECWPGLNDLDRAASDDAFKDLVHEVRLKLLKAFPPRGANKQLGNLDRLLAQLLEHPNETGLETLTKTKTKLTSMTVAQRVRWLAVDALLDEEALRTLEEYAAADQRRIHHLSEFLRDHTMSDWLDKSPLMASQPPKTVAGLIELLGSIHRPLSMEEPGFIPPEILVADRVASLIRQMGSMASSEASAALDELIDNPRLIHWREHLRFAKERQGVVVRDASYSHPGIEQVRRTLDDLAPASAADLAALLEDRFYDIADEIRGSNSNLWRQFWNEDPYGNPTDQKPENSCRDALLEALKSRLPDGVDANPEGQYAASMRADVRVAFGGFNIPIEIKKNSHRDLWEAMRNQLISQYTTDPATSGCGIYLVLWFGAKETWRHPDGSQPATPDELHQRLARDLTPDEARKISVIVMDVTKPA